MRKHPERILKNMVLFLALGLGLSGCSFFKEDAKFSYQELHNFETVSAMEIPTEMFYPEELEYSNEELLLLGYSSDQDYAVLPDLSSLYTEEEMDFNAYLEGLYYSYPQMITMDCEAEYGHKLSIILTDGEGRNHSYEVTLQEYGLSDDLGDMYIDGLTEVLLGKRAGDFVVVDSYQIYIDQIAFMVPYEEFVLTDDYVENYYQDMTGCKTVDELMEWIRQKQRNATGYMEDEIYNNLLENSQVFMSFELLDRVANMVADTIVLRAKEEGFSTEEFLHVFHNNMSLREAALAEAEKKLRHDLIMEGLVKEMEIGVTFLEMEVYCQENAIESIEDHEIPLLVAEEKAWNTLVLSLVNE